MIGIIAFHVAVTTRELGYIPLVGTVLPFLFLLAIFPLTVGLVCCLTVGLSVIGSNVIVTHGGASPSRFSFFSTHSFFFSSSFLGGL